MIREVYDQNKKKENYIRINMLKRSLKLIEYSSRKWHLKFALLKNKKNENDIFDRFSSRRIFHLCKQKTFFFLKILDFLTFGGIVHVFGGTGFGCISLSNFQWYAWGVLKINIFRCIEFLGLARNQLNPAVAVYTVVQVPVYITR